MTHKADRPATSREEGRTGSDQFSWQKMSVHNTKTLPFQQEFSIVSYCLDGGLNVIETHRGSRPREVRS